MSHALRIAAVLQLWVHSSRIEDICVVPLPLSSTFPGLRPCNYLSQTTSNVAISVYFPRIEHSERMSYDFAVLMTITAVRTPSFLADSQH